MLCAKPALVNMDIFRFSAMSLRAVFKGLPANEGGFRKYWWIAQISCLTEDPPDDCFSQPRSMRNQFLDNVRRTISREQALS